jgi:hypothetical protein
MDAFMALMVMTLTQATSLLTDMGQVIGLLAAFGLALVAARLGWHGTDRVIAWRSRTDED